MIKKSRLFIKGLFIIISATLIALLISLFVPTVFIDQGLNYYLRPGTSNKVFIADLSQQKLIHLPLLFSLYVYTQRGAQIKTGEYHFPKWSTPYSIWKQVTSGKGLVYHPFTIVPGWSFSQLRQELLKTQGLRHLTKKMEDNQIMEFFGRPELPAEGEFFPETYLYTKGISDLVILKRAFDLMQTRLQEAWKDRAADLPFKNEYEALIAASMIEKEAYLNSERPVIASVLINRLHKDMLLQFDPTVIYGLGSRYTGKIHKENLLEDTPFNTYVHKGLPPTPIAMPSMTSIEASMHPQNTDYYYFVAKGDGSHQFSKTLIEHNTAISNVIKQHEPYFNDTLIQKYLIYGLQIAS